MTLLTCYEMAIANQHIVDDTAQRELLDTFQALMDALHGNKRPWFLKKAPQGIYLYGAVGVGKTYLLDLFYSQVQAKKARFHFHCFMQQIDSQLRALQGKKNPLLHLAKELAKTVRVLCFDEFMVQDVACAMILAELLQAFIRHGIVLIFSSNTKPDNLYLHGVQRARFLPAIALIKHQCQVLHLDKQRDYRRGRLPTPHAYLYPLNNQTKQILSNQFALLGEPAEAAGNLTVLQRDIPYVQRGTKAIWFKFSQICNLPRSQLDYLEIANAFDTIFLSEVPALQENQSAETLLFIYFIDILYDKGTKLILSAEVAPEALYTKGPFLEVFQRTVSRLLEMQSVGYSG